MPGTGLEITIEGLALAPCWTVLPPGTLWKFARDEDPDPAVWVRLEEKHPGRAPDNDSENLLLTCAGVRRFVLQNPLRGRTVEILGRLRVDVNGIKRWIDE